MFIKNRIDRNAQVNRLFIIGAVFFAHKQVEVTIAVGRKVNIACPGYGDVIFGTVAIYAGQEFGRAIAVSLFYDAVNIIIIGGVAFVFWPVRNKIDGAVGRNKRVGIGI